MTTTMKTEADSIWEQAERIITHRPTTTTGDLARIACLIGRLIELDTDANTALHAVGCDVQIVTMLTGRKWDLFKGMILEKRLEWIKKHHPQYASEYDECITLMPDLRRARNRKSYRANASNGSNRRRRAK